MIYLPTATIQCPAPYQGLLFFAFGIRDTCENLNVFDALGAIDGRFVVVPNLQTTNFHRFVELNHYFQVFWGCWPITYPHMAFLIC